VIIMTATQTEAWTTLPPLDLPARSSISYRSDTPAAVNNYDAGIDQVRYWVGAGLTAGVTALVGIIGLVVARGIVHVPVELGSGRAVNAGIYGVLVVVIALGAAALYDAMLHVAPRPTTYFSWLIAMLTALAALMPFTTSAGLHSQIAFSAMNLAVGLVIMILVPFAAVNARR
jgi:nitrate reductase gamma subunit